MTNHRTDSPIPCIASSWDYAPEIVPAILEATNLQRTAWVVEIGAGSGIFTRHLIGRFNHILAVESDPTLREAAFQQLGYFPSCCVIKGNWDSVDWFENSIDLAVSAQACSLFDPEASLKEFRRILRAPAWFAIVNNYRVESKLNRPFQQTFLQELPSAFLPGSPLEETFLRSYFFSHGFMRMVFPLTPSLSRQNPIDRLRRVSNRTNQSLCPQGNFETKARDIFNSFEISGEVSLQMRTELFVGQL